MLEWPADTLSRKARGESGKEKRAAWRAHQVGGPWVSYPLYRCESQHTLRLESHLLADQKANLSANAPRQIIEKLPKKIQTFIILTILAVSPKRKVFDNFAIFLFFAWGHVQESLVFGYPGDGFQCALRFTPVQGVWLVGMVYPLSPPNEQKLTHSISITDVEADNEHIRVVPVCRNLGWSDQLCYPIH